MALEICVVDSVQVVDILPGGLDAGLQIIEAVTKAIKNWVMTGMKTPLNITVRQQEATGPPTDVNINVADGARVGEAIN